MVWGRKRRGEVIPYRGDSKGEVGSGNRAALAVSTKGQFGPDYELHGGLSP